MKTLRGSAATGSDWGVSGSPESHPWRAINVLNTTMDVAVDRLNKRCGDVEIVSAPHSRVKCTLFCSSFITLGIPVLFIVVSLHADKMTEGTICCGETSLQYLLRNHPHSTSVMHSTRPNTPHLQADTFKWYIFLALACTHLRERSCTQDGIVKRRAWR